MLYFVTQGSQRSQIPGACCAYAKAVDEAKRILTTHCQGYPGAAEYFTVMFKQAAADAMDLVCGRYRTVDSCKSMGVAYMNKLDDIASNPGQQKTGFLVPLITITNKMGIIDTVQHAIATILS